MLAIVEDLLEDIHKAVSDAGIASALQEIANHFGFRSGYLIEYADPPHSDVHVIDTIPARVESWVQFLRGALNDVSGLQADIRGIGLIILGVSRFTTREDGLYEFCEANDLLEAAVVPIQYSSVTVGFVGFSGLNHLDNVKQMSLQILSYSIFARVREIRKITSDPIPTVLSGREKTVMRMSAEGMTSADIAQRLGLSTRTVNQYVTNVARKLGTRSRAHAVAEAMRRRLLE